MSAKQVITISEDELEEVVNRLVIKILEDDFHPQAVIGIATGGAIVARKINPALGWVLLECTLQRPSTSTKSRFEWIPRTLQRLPRRVADQLRLIEDKIGMLKGPRSVVDGLDEALAGPIQSIRTQHLKRILVMDDAVDSGATLASVVAKHADSLASNVDVRTCAITQTRSGKASLVTPDYKIFDQTLCRFHWSLDYPGAL